MGSTGSTETGSPAPHGSLTQFSRLGRGLLVLLKHALGIFALLAVFRILELVLSAIHGKSGLFFFGSLDVRYMFHLADLVMLVWFLGRGVIEFLRAQSAASQQRPWYMEFVGLGRGALQLLRHLVGISALLAFIKVIKLGVIYFNGEHGLILFDRFNTEYIFQTADLFMLAGFLSIATWQFFNAFKES
jgi:hypothetical protein